MQSQKYIGGEFCAADAQAWQLSGPSQFADFFPEQLNGHNRLLAETGSDAMALILLQLHARLGQALQLWMPANFCFESLERALLKAKSMQVEIMRYREMHQVKLAPTGITTALLHLHFNGYQPADFTALRQQGIVVIEDFVQAPLDIRHFTADFAFNSLRKLGPYEAAVAYAGSAFPESVSDQPSVYYQLKQQASALKTEVQQQPDPEKEEQYLKLYRQAEEHLHQSQLYRAQPAEVQKLEQADLSGIRQRREQNYAHLHQLLSQVPELELLPGSYMYLMVRTTKQAALHRFCFQNGIFPAIHWLDSETPESGSLLSFHTDQRYSQADMERIAGTVTQFFRQQHLL